MNDELKGASGETHERIHLGLARGSVEHDEGRPAIGASFVVYVSIVRLDPNRRSERIGLGVFVRRVVVGHSSTVKANASASMISRRQL